VAVKQSAVAHCKALCQTIGSGQIQTVLARQANLKKRMFHMDAGALGQFVPLILIFAIMYFLLIRPQQKKLKDHQKMVEGLSRGDQVVTQGGLIGKVTKVKDNNEIEVEVADGVKVRVVQSTITSVINRTEPASA
jgi:preprotein translocase subunit YajC